MIRALRVSLMNAKDGDAPPMDADEVAGLLSVPKGRLPKYLAIFGLTVFAGLVLSVVVSVASGTSFVEEVFSVGSRVGSVAAGCAAILISGSLILGRGSGHGRLQPVGQESRTAGRATRRAARRTARPQRGTPAHGAMAGGAGRGGLRPTASAGPVRRRSCSAAGTRYLTSPPGESRFHDGEFHCRRCAIDGPTPAAISSSSRFGWSQGLRNG